MLRRYLDPNGAHRILEISSGSGQHVAHFAAHYPHARFLPTEIDEKAMASIRAYIEESNLDNVHDPVFLDIRKSPPPPPHSSSSSTTEDDNANVGDDVWEEETQRAIDSIVRWENNSGDSGNGSGFDALICINLIHISEFECTRALFRNASKLVKEGGYVFTYGPYNVDGQFTSDSNRLFDQSLKERHAAWGIRDVKDVTDVATENGFKLVERVSMPANDFTLVFQRKE